MKALVSIGGAWKLGAAVIFAAIGLGCTSSPGIRGNYVLEYRELPDGKTVRPPDIMGMMTFTKDHRNFNVYWTQDGKPASLAIVSKYRIDESEFTEENMYYMSNGLDGKGPTYDTASGSGTAHISKTDGKMQWKFPLHDEPKVTFSADGFTATAPGKFVDHWKKMH
jgi:hypothetical protein